MPWIFKKQQHVKRFVAPMCPWCGIHMKYKGKFSLDGNYGSKHVCPRCGQKYHLGKGAWRRR